MAMVGIAKLPRKIMLTLSVLSMAICQLIIGYCMHHNENRNQLIDESAKV